MGHQGEPDGPQAVQWADRQGLATARWLERERGADQGQARMHAGWVKANGQLGSDIQEAGHCERQECDRQGNHVR